MLKRQAGVWIKEVWIKWVLRINMNKRLMIKKRKQQNPFSIKILFFAWTYVLAVADTDVIGHVKYFDQKCIHLKALLRGNMKFFHISMDSRQGHTQRRRLQYHTEQHNQFHK